MSVDISNPSVLSSSLNVSQIGEIPVGGLQTWALSLHCGPYNVEVDLSLRINVSLPRKNITTLEFKRKKICMKKESYTEPEEVLVAASDSTSGGQIFYVAIGCACAFMAAIFVLITAYYVRDKKTRRHRDPLQWVKHTTKENRAVDQIFWGMLKRFMNCRESRGLSSACSMERGTGVGPAQTFLSPETPPPTSAASGSSYRRLDDRPNRELHERIQEITVQRWLLHFKIIKLIGLS